MYGLPDPLAMLESPPPSKNSWKGDITTIITSYHEKQMRSAASSNSKMEWLNVSMSGLQGKSHPIFRDITTADQVKKLYPVLKMLTGDLYTYDLKYKQGGGTSPHCRLCGHPVENLQHVFSCPSTSEPRLRVQSELKSILCNSGNDKQINAMYHTKILTTAQFDDLISDPRTFTQFCVDCTSFNLPDDIRVNVSDVRLSQIFRTTRDMCYSIHMERLRKLKELQG